MSYKPQRTFNGTQGNPSTDTMGPEQLSHDIDELCKMFNPNAVHDDGAEGGVNAENLNFDINDIDGVESTDIKSIRVKTNGDLEYTTDGTTYHPAFAREDNYLAKAGGTMTGDIAMGGNKVTGLGTPSADTDAAPKKYVDETAASTVNDKFFAAIYGTTTYADVLAAYNAGKLIYAHTSGKNEVIPLTFYDSTYLRFYFNYNNQYQLVLYRLSQSNGWETIASNTLASIVSPNFTGTPTTPDLTSSSGGTQIANKNYVDGLIASVSLPSQSGHSGEFLKTNGSSLSWSDTPMIKGVDYVTAGKKNGTTLGAYATAEGYNTTASGAQSHAEGSSTTASGNLAHAEGFDTVAGAGTSHAEGYKTITYNPYSHAEGQETETKGTASHAEGIGTIANDAAQHAGGKYNVAQSGAEVIGGGSADDARLNIRTLDWSGNEVLAGKLTLGAGPTNNMDAATKQYVDSMGSGLPSQTGHSGEFLTTDGTDASWAAVDALPTQTGQSGKFLTTDGTDASWTDTPMIKGTDYVTAGKKSGTTLGTKATAEGSSTTASGNNSHAEGESTKATGYGSHAEGSSTTASGSYAHAEGSSTKASGSYSHAEGDGTTASSTDAHAEGSATTASGADSHAEGFGSTASGHESHAEGFDTIANHRSQHVFGEYNVADTNASAANARGDYVEIVGNGSNNNRSNARTLDWSGNEVLAGKLTVGTAPTNNMDVTTKGYVDTAISGIDGLPSQSGQNGKFLTTNGTSANWSSTPMVKGTDYVTAGKKSGTTLGLLATAEGTDATASGIYSHAEGLGATASGEYSHAEGGGTTASGTASHSEGNDTVASGDYSHAEGDGTIANSVSQHVFGAYNDPDPNDDPEEVGTYIEIVGNGTSNNNRSTARTLDWSGNEVVYGKITVGEGPYVDMDVATKLYVDTAMQYIPFGSSTSPAMDGTASAGSETTWAHGDHVHPTDTSRQVKITASGILKGDGAGGVTAAVAGTDYLTLATLPIYNGTVV